MSALSHNPCLLIGSNRNPPTPTQPDSEEASAARPERNKIKSQLSVLTILSIASERSSKNFEKKYKQASFSSTTLMVLTRLVFSESSWAVVIKVRLPHTGPEVWRGTLDHTHLRHRKTNWL